MIQILHLHAQCVQICCGSVETGIDSLSTVSIWYSSTERLCYESQIASVYVRVICAPYL